MTEEARETTEIDGVSRNQSHVRRFERLNTASAIVITLVGLAFSIALPRADGSVSGILAVTLGLAAFTAAWRRWLPQERRGSASWFQESAMQSVAVAGLVMFSGGAESPALFLFYPPLVLSGLLAGRRASLVTIGVATAGFLLASSLPDPGGIAIRSVDWWADLAALWVVGVTAALLGAEFGRTQKEMSEEKERAERFSSVDWLTGLYNRRHLEFILPQEIARARRHERPVSLMIVDADHLKEVNDNLGHLMGDQLLIHVAEVLSAQVRLVDTVIRFGGDEFAVIMPDTGVEGASIPAERIRAAMSGYALTASGITVKASISAGLASFPEDADDGPALVACADAALYVSKRNGRDRVTLYRPEYEGVTEPVGRG
ncbi:MAG: GGDEF domain-containing protein [Chloroflexi bacterium]|nr:GGDEF domain-containing protein [Chloroflexota bacterium]